MNAKATVKSVRSLAIGCALLGTAIASSALAQEFSYNGDTGPAYWHELNPTDWAACEGMGMAQSPINIRTVKPDNTLKPLDLVTFPTAIDIFNNGHTIEQRYEDTGTMIYFEGVAYELLQFHFHTLSEHTIGARHSLIEMHLVFGEMGGDTNLVVAQLFEAGQPVNDFIQALIDAGLPQKDGDETQTTDLIDVSDGLADTKSYYTYQGSLTTPPCSEVVTWVVLKKPAIVTQSQYQAFRRILGNNFRPIQDTADRVVRTTVRGGPWYKSRGNEKK